MIENEQIAVVRAAVVKAVTEMKEFRLVPSDREHVGGVYSCLSLSQVAAALG
jgi:hypothetical protein